MNFKFSQQPGLKLNKKTSTKDNRDALVTIITPYYNAGKYFEQTFNSVINQTFPWFEWIIIDDGSTDSESLDILDKFKNMDIRIKVYHKKNGGPSSARNYAIEKMSTDIYVTVDSDDLISPQYLEYGYFGLFFNPDIDFCYTWSTGFETQEYLWKKNLMLKN